MNLFFKDLLAEMDTKAFLALLVVLVPACIGGGYIYGTDLNKAEVSRLENLLSDEKRITEFDSEKFFFRLTKFQANQDELDNLQQSVNELRKELDTNVAHLEKTLREMAVTKEKLLKATVERDRLSNLISGQFDMLDEFSVSKNSTKTLVPGEIFVGVGNIYSGFAMVTITGGPTDENLQLGEKLEFVVDQTSCSLILTGVQEYRSATFTYSCAK